MSSGFSCSFLELQFNAASAGHRYEATINFDGGKDEEFLRFLQLAQPNTMRNTETCGILAGVINKRTLVLNTLIIPKQTGSSDMTEMTHEDEVR